MSIPQADLVKKIRSAKEMQTTYGDSFVSPIALRPGQTDYDAFRGNVDSVKAHGIIYTPKARLAKESPDGEKIEVVEGAQRRTWHYTAWCETLAEQHPGWSEEKVKAEAAKQPFNILVADFTDHEVRLLQMLANTKRKANSKKERAQQMSRMIADENCTVAEVATIYCESIPEIYGILNLVNLDDRLDEFMEKSKPGMNRNQLPANVAIQLSKLPKEQQIELVSDGVLNLSPKDRDGKIDAAISLHRKGQRLDAKEYTLPKPRFVGLKALNEKVNAAKEVDPQFAEGLLAAIGQDAEGLKNHRLEWEANKESKSIDAQLKKAQADVARLQEQSELSTA